MCKSKCASCRTSALSAYSVKRVKIWPIILSKIVSFKENLNFGQICQFN